MGLRRRLSKKWNETVNGVLSGPGVDVDSVNTDEIDIGKLIAALDANGYDITGVGSLTADETKSDIIRYSQETKNLIDFDYTTLDSGQTRNLNDNLERQSGLLIVRRSSFAETGLFDLQGNFDDVAELIDGSQYSTTQGTAGSTNIYHDGTDYILENNLADNNSYALTIIGGV